MADIRIVWYIFFMKTIAQFTITKDADTYIAEGVDLAIVTQANNLDTLMENIKEAVALYFENEDADVLNFSAKPSIFVNFEVPQYA